MESTQSEKEDGQSTIEELLRTDLVQRTEGTREILESVKIVRVPQTLETSQDNSYLCYVGGVDNAEDTQQYAEQNPTSLMTEVKSTLDNVNLLLKKVDEKFSTSNTEPFGNFVSNEIMQIKSREIASNLKYNIINLIREAVAADKSNESPESVPVMFVVKQEPSIDL